MASDLPGLVLAWLRSGWTLGELTAARAAALQRLLAWCVSEEPPRDPLAAIAGVDVAYEPAGRRAHAAVAVWDVATSRLVEVKTAPVASQNAYAPGFLAWRELSPVMAALGLLERRPDVVLCDGHGRAHPRRCGLACLVGLVADVPAVGCAKSLLVGRAGALASGRGASAPLDDGGETIGLALRTRAETRPVFVSVGHRITLEAAREVVLSCSRTRIPEPLRAAHVAATRAARASA